MSNSIKPFIHRKVVVLHEDETAEHVAQAMCENEIGCVVLADHKGRISGIVTDRNLACGILALRLKGDSPVRLVMSRTIVTVPPEASIPQVVALMKKYGIRRIPVVQATARGLRKCVGIMTLDDLIASQSITLDDVAQVVRSQVKRRMASKPQNNIGPKGPALSEFFKEVSLMTGFPVNRVRSMTNFVLSQIVRRLNYTAGVHLVHGLPVSLQPQLLRLPPGPERRVTSSEILAGVRKELECSDQEAREFLASLWKNLKFISLERSMDHAWDQLPEDIQKLLQPPAKPVHISLQDESLAF